MAIGDYNFLKWLEKVDNPLAKSCQDKRYTSNGSSIDFVHVDEVDLKPGDAILYNWTTTDNTNEPNPPQHFGIDLDQIFITGDTSPIIVHPGTYRKLVNGARTYDLEFNLDEAKLCNVYLSPEVLELINRFKQDYEGTVECLARILPILEALVDKLEGYRTGGIPV